MPILRSGTDKIRAPAARRAPASAFVEAALPTALVLALMAALPACREPTGETTGAAPGAKRVTIIDLVESPGSEESRQGVMAGLAAAGLVEGSDIVVTHTSAQGDMSLLLTIVDAARTRGVDLFVTISTPTLQALLQRGAGIPTVFTYCANPVLAGAGTSDRDHVRWVTGVYTPSDMPGMLEVVSECLPRARRLGTLFCPAEVNSVFYRDELAKEAKARGMELVSLPVNAPSDVPDAATALCANSIDVVCQILDNLTGATFAGISIAATRSGKPLFAFASGQVNEGAVLAVARDHFDAGHAAGLLAARVLRGESPAQIPFQASGGTRLIVNLQTARRFGVTIPESVTAKAWRVVGN